MGLLVNIFHRLAPGFLQQAHQQVLLLTEIIRTVGVHAQDQAKTPGN